MYMQAVGFSRDKDLSSFFFLLVRVVQNPVLFLLSCWCPASIYCCS